MPFKPDRKKASINAISSALKDHKITVDMDVICVPAIPGHDHDSERHIPEILAFYQDESFLRNLFQYM